MLVPGAASARDCARSKVRRSTNLRLPCAKSFSLRPGIDEVTAPIDYESRRTGV